MFITMTMTMSHIESAVTVGQASQWFTICVNLASNDVRLIGTDVMIQCMSLCSPSDNCG